MLDVRYAGALLGPGDWVTVDGDRHHLPIR
jgi:hypothetical protein